MSNNHGGSRPGAGRPKNPKSKLTKENSKVCRLSLADYSLIKSGKYHQLMQVLYDWKLEADSSSKTSPRWKKIREFFSEVESILGDDVDSWIN